MKSSLVVRARVLCGLFVVAAILLIIRLYFVQIVHGSEYRESATSQYVEQSYDSGSRGTIFFTDKDGEHVASAVMQSGWRIAIKPADIPNAQSTYEALNAVVPVDQERFFASARKNADPYEEVAFRVSDQAATAIRALKLPGVMLVRDQWRLYPASELAAHVVGFVGYRGDQKEGVYGLERTYEDTLAMTSSGLYVNPFAEIFANVGALLSSDPTAHKGSVITSIEPKAQQELESTLSRVMDTYSPRFSGGIVMDPHTGEIVAMAVHPTFDPNTYNAVEDVSRFSNPLVEGAYEMGSIMKPLTMAIGIDTGSITPNTKYKDTGCIQKSGKKICNYDGKARDVVDMQEVLNKSLNLGASFIVDKVGHERFAQYVHALGFDKKTNIDLPNEAAGLISAIDGGSDVDYASASFGQGIAVTSLEMTRALAALANGGVMPAPHVATGIKYQNGVTRSIDPKEGTRVFKSESAQTVTQMLVSVYDHALLDGTLKDDHYSIAAKTGTAQIAIPGGGGYYSDRYLHSFFGYFPAHDPQFIIFLFAVEPHGAEFASATLAKPFAGLAKFLINYYQIPPDR